MLIYSIVICSFVVACCLFVDRCLWCVCVVCCLPFVGVCCCLFADCSCVLLCGSLLFVGVRRLCCVVWLCFGCSLLAARCSSLLWVVVCC